MGDPLRDGKSLAKHTWRLYGSLREICSPPLYSEHELDELPTFIKLPDCCSITYSQIEEKLFFFV